MSSVVAYGQNGPTIIEIKAVKKLYGNKNDFYDFQMNILIEIDKFIIKFICNDNEDPEKYYRSLYLCPDDTEVMRKLKRYLRSNNSINKRIESNFIEMVRKKQDNDELVFIEYLNQYIYIISCDILKKETPCYSHIYPITIKE